MPTVSPYVLFVACLLVPACDGSSDRADEAGAKNQAAQVSSAEDVAPLDLTTFNSARTCGSCHQSIYATWRQSMHARSWSNPIFQAARRQAVEATSEEKARLCMSCHAPTVRETKDYAAELVTTKEGVTCDFCHSVRGVDPRSTEHRFDLNVGAAKYGPLKHAQSPAHEVVDSDLHRRSELCAGCHEYRNEHGVAILTTYSEWKAGPYAAEGRQCQDCHMPVVPGRLVALKTSNANSRAGVNLHDISGSHDLERVRKAVALDILYTTWLNEGSALARIEVANIGSGHYLPTGMPLHRVVLEVRLTNRGRLVKSQTVPFERVLLDEKGTPISAEYEAFFFARSEQSDTRLKPRERRTVKVSFDGVVAYDGVVEAYLWYEYSTHTLRTGPEGESIEPVEMKFLLASQKQTLPRLGR